MKNILVKWTAEMSIHILIWIIFIFYETVLTGLVLGSFANPLVYILHYLINISFFYFCGGIALPNAFTDLNKSIWKVPVLIIPGIIYFILTGYLADIWLTKNGLLANNVSLNFNKEYILRVLYRCFYFLGFSTGYYFLKQFIKARKNTELQEKRRYEEIIKVEKMEKALSRAQNAFLKAQIKPHFLFNTLDYVYHNLEEESNAANAILALSDMMRFAVDLDEVSEFIPFWNEILQSEKLISIYQLRANHKLNIKSSFSKDLEKAKFLPLVLLTLTENIFKHGDLGNPVYPASISARVKGKRIEIESKNLAKGRLVSNTLSSGLKNIEKRLQFTYGSNASINSKLDPNMVFHLSISFPALFY
ncbi:Histidine kinase [Pedobacter terrae]|uniref:Histidine kinase n=1 Tax=Pedobacter terrae TaxID=405671 RepID=A0A1G8CLC9_9SPHI|nr:histidine kinase [Pedobacter terrae]SDH46347.1 Histidine kinase [Pedobacter terrae]